MRNILLAAVMALSAAACSYKGNADIDTLWYTTPAGQWEEALPVGNGRLGAMVFGNTGTERIQFNENTLYSGGPQPDLGIDITEDLGTVRKYLSMGRNDKAGELMQRKWIGRLNEAYQPFGDIFIDFGDSSGISGYRHSLDMRKATVTTSYTKNGVGITRQVFASCPAQAIIIHIEAEKPVLDFTVGMSSPHPAETISEDNALTMSGRAPSHAQRRDIANMREFHTERLHPEYFDKDGNVIREDHVLYEEGPDGKGMRFEACLVPLSHKGGTLGSKGGTISAKGCKEVTLMLYASTSYNGPDKDPGTEGRDPHKEIERCMDLISERVDYHSIRMAHEKDFGELFDRVSLALPSTEEQKALPTDERLKAFAAQEDPGLIAQLFQFGRYLMISGSREGGQPLNLQGLWNDKVLPPWNSGYTLNINLEMNYWPAEVCNLSECHQPLFGLIREIASRGEKIAREMYGLDGWAIHHNISIWREGYPSDGFVYWFFWNMSGPWLCSHIWEHYLYTGDRDFLMEYYPIMKGASEFFSGWLTENSSGELVTPVGTSPENAYILPDGTPASVCEGATMDMAIIRNLFSNTAEASEILGIDEEFRECLNGKAARLADYRIGSKGQLLEWDKEYEESEPRHRHVSHLFGLFPGNDINSGTPELLDAARKSLELRGNKATGWSMAWKIALWARLHDAANAHEALSNLVNLIEPENTGENSGGLYRNLLNALPFQIDGNFGATAGIAEMLLQSHENRIDILPALPESWESGSVSGLKARGGYTVDIRWTKDEVIATIKGSGNQADVKVSYGNETAVLKSGETRKFRFSRRCS